MSEVVESGSTKFIGGASEGAFGANKSCELGKLGATGVSASAGVRP